MKILAVSGHSGGHIFPALGFLDALKDRNKDIGTLLVLPKKNAAGLAESRKHKMNFISISNFRPGPGAIPAVFNFFKGSIESLSILAKFKPDAVVGFGSIASVPMVFFAHLFKIKTMIHEQNVVPGRATRFLAGFTDKVAVSFEGTRQHLKRYEDKVVFTGNPLRPGLARIDKNKALDFFGFKSGRFTILVMGGSQSSRAVNAGFLSATAGIPDKTGLQVIHLCGNKDREFLENGYRELKVDFRLFEFLQQMEYAYSACDLAVSRAGATAIAEMIHFALPAILIPYPLAYGHQKANAGILEDMGSAIVIEENQLGSGELGGRIGDLIHNQPELERMRSSYARFPGHDARALLIEAALN